MKSRPLGSSAAAAMLHAACAILLAACNENDAAAPAPSAREIPATVEADPHTIPAHEPERATDAPAPEPADDEGERLYREGRRKQAIAYWQKAAAQGDAYAHYRLGVEYLDAKVVERDVEKAAAHQRRATELGDPRAMFELATLHEYGQGVEQSPEQAAKYYLMAAERGLPEAQHNIATLFETGTGVRKDLVQAYKFHALAQANGFLAPAGFGGDAQASDPLRALEQVMTAEQVAEARRQIAEFKPKE